MLLGRAFGVRVRVHPVFAALVGLAAAVGFGRQTLVLLVLLGSHELAHLTVARAFGLDVEEVELWPFGGVARIADLEWAEPGVEATVALVGPLNNLVLLAAGAWAGRLGWLPAAGGTFFATANLVLGLCNLLPALPLDGGRALRALLAAHLGYGAATRRLVGLGQALALACVVAGGVALAGGTVVPGLFVYGAFLHAAARRERREVSLHMLRQLWRRPAMAQAVALHPLAADPGLRLRDLVPRFVPGRYHLVWVVDAGGRVLGRLDEADLLAAVADRGLDATVGELLGRRP